MNTSRSYNFYYNIMPDGTVKQINPFTGTEVWAVPGRGDKPLTNEVPLGTKDLVHTSPERYCSFCETRYYDVPPEKARLVRQDGAYRTILRVSPDHYNDSVAEFRRVGNLFEIVTIDYWKKNYNYRLTKDAAAWRDAYASNPRGAEHIDAILNYKLKIASRSEQEIRRKLQLNRENMMDAFFGGCHEIIIAHKHYVDGARFETQLHSSGEMTQEEHFHYFRFTVEAMRDMLSYNRYVRYISVFQNWLRPAGASFDHLHKQLVGLDEWGNSMLMQIQMLRDDPNIFNELGANFAAQYNLVFAENEFAIACVGIGHRYPTIEIYSKSQASRPFEHTDQELRGVSNLVHACHAAMGGQVSCNEEWYYTPIDAVYKMPWHVLLKWRVNVPAGFEGGTSIYINPLTPIDLRDKLVPRMYHLRDSGVITNLSIAEECHLAPNPLLYYLK
jgi:galactose-1-phosphate uridylyltransferase